MSSAKSRRLASVLLRQGRSTDPDIRIQSLETLGADDFLATGAMPWTVAGWISVFAITQARWSLLFAALDVGLCGLRIWLMRWRGRRGEDADRLMSAVWTSLAWTVLVAVLVFVLFQTRSERTLMLGTMMWIGTTGYLGALFAAFPTLALVGVGLVNVAAAIGLATGWSDAARPFALISVGITCAYCFLTRRTHRVLIGAMRAQQVSRRLALHDPLTKLPNRALLRERMTQFLARAEAATAQARLAVLCLDLDGFKTVNDRHGHAAGDWVLIHVADILRSAILPDDVAARIGGDEFVVLLADADVDRVRAVAESIIDAVRQPFDIGRVVPATIGVSIGATLVDKAAGGIDAVFEDADAALYLAKNGGKGRLHFVEPAPGQTRG